ncbi:hypothetical protein ACA910_008118 [Epithemia clementina (nom. ined.)]
MSNGNHSRNHHDAASAQHNYTYEGARARQSAEFMADKVHWEEGYSFRGQPYRYLHHQRGIIGTFTIRLLEARDLKRSYWSALALGPVKHFGLSKAHGEVTSFCTMALDFVEEEEDAHHKDDYYQTTTSTQKSQQSIDQKNSPLALPGSEDRKQPADGKRSRTSWADRGDVQKSPIISQNNNPVWDNVSLAFPLRKNAMPVDGMRILVKLRVDEDSTAVENLFPIGGNHQYPGRLLGMGEIDVTDLCLGQTKQGQALPGIQDAWIPISLPPSSDNRSGGDNPQQRRQPSSDLKKAASSSTTDNDDDDDDSLNKKKDPLASEPLLLPNGAECTGRVRIFVSYEPYGMEPQKNDIVALECFARRNWTSASCRPILYPSLQPMRVLDRRPPYLLVATLAGLSNSGTAGNQQKHAPHRIRLHRNNVFVVERQNLVDAAQNLAWLPADFLLSTPIGQAAGEMAGPVVAAGQELLMPAMLSMKLFWMALRTTAIASVSSIQALGSTFVQEGANSLLYPANRGPAGRRNDNDGHNNSNKTSSSIKLIQL